MFSLFTSHSFAAKKHKIYKKLPCSFNGAKVSTSANAAVIRSTRCSKGRGYKGKKGTSIEVKRGTPVFAITDMKILYIKDKSAKQRCKWFNRTQKKGVCDRPYDDVQLLFEDKNGVEIFYYHLMDTTFVPGFGKGKCERPLEFNTEPAFFPYNCGGYSKEIVEKKLLVKKGDIIGHSGTTGYDDKGDQHISLGARILTKNLVGREKKLCEKLKKREKMRLLSKNLVESWKCRVAPEIYFKWENLPTDSDAYLFPIMSKEYLKEIGYYK
jgi:uncharacterized protein YodC (DUF2158 family)